MSEPTPFAISQLLSDLTGQEVTVSLVIKPSESNLAQIYGIYSAITSNTPVMVKADLRLMALLGAALLGLPADTAIEYAQADPMAESIRDAIHEVLNISSTFLSTAHRIVFKSMALDPIYCETPACELLKKADLRSTFSVSVGRQPAGLLTVLSSY